MTTTSPTVTRGEDRRMKAVAATRAFDAWFDGTATIREAIASIRAIAGCSTADADRFVRATLATMERGRTADTLAELDAATLAIGSGR